MKKSYDRKVHLFLVNSWLLSDLEYAKRKMEIQMLNISWLFFHLDYLYNYYILGVMQENKLFQNEFFIE